MICGPVLLAGFLAWQRVAPSPLLPLQILRSRTRGAAYLSRFVASVGNFALIFFMAFVLQEVFHFSPLLTGLAITPLVLGYVLASTLLATRIASRLRYRSIVFCGLFLGAVSLALLSLMDPATSYWSGMAGPLVVFGLGQGLTTATTMNAGIDGVRIEDRGVASATVNLMQQLGAAVGTAALSNVAVMVTSSYLTERPGAEAEATTHGVAIALLVTSQLFLLSAVICPLIAGPSAACRKSLDGWDLKS